MSNTYYIKQPNGVYKKVTYTEKEVLGNLQLSKEELPKGETGSQGQIGLSGKDGRDGRDGINGLEGKPGIHGLDGYTPVKGIDYFDGYTPELGIDYFNGIDGRDGIDGKPGANGLDGYTPVKGIDYFDGLQGEIGPIGPTGATGPKGADGRDGRDGRDGANGLIGPIGPKGDDGQIGPTGATGARGKDGEKGERGFPGVPGISGKDGGAYQLRFVDKPTTIPAGYEQVAYDLYVVDKLTVAAATNTYNFGSQSISNAALLNIKEDLWIDGEFNVYGTVTFDYKHVIKHYGSWYDTTTQTNLGATYANIMTFNTPDVIDGVSMVNNSEITFNQDGVYNIQFSAQIEKTDSGADEIEVWIAKNGQNLSYTSTTLELQGNNVELVAAWNFFVDVDKGDYVQLLWHSNDTAMRILSRGSQTNPQRPEIPSVILTVTQV